MCYNCEGEVDLDVIVCPFCAADLREEKPEQQAFHQVASVKNLNTQQSLYPSSYPPRAKPEEPPIQETQETALETEEETKGSYSSILLLTLGSQLLILGLFMLFFSSQGSLVLKWDARFWYFYVLASIPLFIFGVKSYQKIK